MPKNTPGQRASDLPDVDGSTPHAIVLVGFMGSGKSSVGKALAQRLGWRFRDLDEEIESRCRRKIGDIFRAEGEESFRAVEHEALREMLKEAASTPTVAALGGGAYARQENIELIRSSTVTAVFLDGPVDELWQRCQTESKERPLLKSQNQFRQLYETRRSFYMTARLRIETSAKQIDTIAAEIALQLGLNQDEQGDAQ